MSDAQPSAESSTTDRSADLVGIGTIGRYLVGQRAAILALGRCQHLIWLGLLFVVAAGFTREYDGEDLLHEPWHLLLPLGASLVSSLVLYVLFRSVAWIRGARQVAFWAPYLAFLGLFWMTAPMAWLYAIPVERFLQPADAVRVNLWLLGIVSAWRVLLISRVLSALYNCRFIAALLVVMLFSVAVVFTVLQYTPLPVFSIMGGIRLTDSERVIRETACLVGLLATLTLPFWLIGTVCVTWPSVYRRPWRYELAAAPRQGAISQPAWLLAAGAVLVWVAVLPFTQWEQQNRWRAETAMRDGRIDEALQEMSRHSRAEFPPHWDPPPRIGYGETTPSMEAVLDAVLRQPGLAQWVRELFLEKATVQARYGRFPMRNAITLHRMGDDPLVRYVDFLEQHPDGVDLAGSHRAEIDGALRDESDWSIGFEELPELTPRRRETLERLQSLADREEDGA